MKFIFVLAKNVLLCHFILFVFPPQNSCNYCTSQTVDSIIENGRAIYEKCYATLIERLEKKYNSFKMFVCLKYQSILHDKINSACLKKSTIPLMFQALK